MIKGAYRGLVVLMWVLLGLACQRRSSASSDGSPEVSSGDATTSRPIGVRKHSTLADTAGLARDIGILERKLGPLSPGIREHLTAVEVTYFSFKDSGCTEVDKQQQYTGILLVHACIAEDVRSIFEGLRRDTFPIGKVVPINRYGFDADSTGWNDAASMADNNTSAFNYRSKPTSAQASKHSQGIAIDINPMLNPFIRTGENGILCKPANGRYAPDRPGTLTRARIMKHLAPLGWTWGGRWTNPVDHQHIEKLHPLCTHMTARIR